QNHNLQYYLVYRRMDEDSENYQTLRELVTSYVGTKPDGKEYKGLRAIQFQENSKRYYPYGDLASHLIGFTGTDNNGLNGIEALYDDYLTGVNGSTVRLTASNGRDLLYENYENYNDASDGCSLTLTLDATVQGVAEKYLRQAIEENYILNGGCVIVQRTKTGEILAMACANDYDLNSPFTLPEEVQADLDNIASDEVRSTFRRNALESMWRNMAVSDTYEPGSVFKILTMAMALEEGIVTLDENFPCGGKISAGTIVGRDTDLYCWKHAGHGDQNLRQAAMHSCNVAFANIGLRVGPQRFYQYVQAFGLWEKTGIDLLGETGTRSLWWSEEYFYGKYGKSSLAVAAFGQTANVTPIQMVTAVSACVNGGYLMEPYVVAEVRDAAGELVYSHEPTAVRQVISENTSRTVADILESVVGDPGGTGGNAYVAGYHVGGKTGTTTKTVKEAELEVKEYMVSFCGIAPANDPEITVLVVLDNPKQGTGVYTSGGVMAAPAVGRIIAEVLPYLGVEPDYNENESKYVDVTVPRVVGDTVAEAREKMREKGFTVEVVGEGGSITAQLPLAGTEIAAGSRILLYADAQPQENLVSVPNLLNLSATAARRTLELRGLFVETSGALPTSGNVVVSGQSVPAGNELSYGSIVHVTMIDKSNLGQY
ncbi:MAG: penicillin-binding transpeptidase domain-containing protein, partial [bacterium]